LEIAGAMIIHPPPKDEQECAAVLARVKRTRWSRRFCLSDAKLLDRWFCRGVDIDVASPATGFMGDDLDKAYPPRGSDRRRHCHPPYAVVYNGSVIGRTATSVPTPSGPGSGL
jgi:hypothetical protein